MCLRLTGLKSVLSSIGVLVLVSLAGRATASQYSDQVIADGAIHYWRFEESSTAESAKDEITGAAGQSNNPGTYSGNIMLGKQNFGTTGPPNDGTLIADANDDRLVTGADLIAVQQNFGNVLSVPGAPVPEPALLAMMSFCASTLLLRRSI